MRSGWWRKYENIFVSFLFFFPFIANIKNIHCSCSNVFVLLKASLWRRKQQQKIRKSVSRHYLICFTRYGNSRMQTEQQRNQKCYLSYPKQLLYRAAHMINTIHSSNVIRIHSISSLFWTQRRENIIIIEENKLFEFLLFLSGILISWICLPLCLCIFARIRVCLLTQK